MISDFEYLKAGPGVDQLLYKADLIDADRQESEFNSKAFAYNLRAVRAWARDDNFYILAQPGPGGLKQPETKKRSATPDIPGAISGGLRSTTRDKLSGDIRPAVERLRTLRSPKRSREEDWEQADIDRRRFQRERQIKKLELEIKNLRHNPSSGERGKLNLGEFSKLHNLRQQLDQLNAGESFVEHLDALFKLI